MELLNSDIMFQEDLGLCARGVSLGEMEMIVVDRVHW